MKKYNLLKKASLLLLFVIISSCRQDNEKLGDSILVDQLPYTPNATDVWLKTNFEIPFNIAALYRWEPQYVDYNRYLFPPKVTSVKPAMEIVKTMWVDTYSKIGGNDFLKKLAPREIILIGGVNKNKEGTITLGVAEGGVRFTLFQTDDLIDKITDKNASSDSKKVQIRQFIHTVQHEYVHILNQNKPYDEKALQAIVREGGLGQYKSDWYSDSDDVAREKGFITAYAQSNIGEDFAEMASFMLQYSKSEYDVIINNIKEAKAKNLIRAKEKLVVDYYKDKFDINFYDLVAESDKNSQIVFNLYK
ncbi:substrate import-associated zinc metallohydrolase lipoprotein [Elizabethkingia sp. YR214]|uniref:substrate import-associated zinc metallohydrolase lipoprotein n=1 Tax=Elizabethkingia sp. YR214 TaxID=2135667 RepID=UPI000D31CDF5|nr:substrate import-associated zinc metallohydrolase lipoprotein [Elizabethkingia sp. YR214]PUB29383.1 substrate import-associated zinc metallohydrolase lipoprotein [Elizabethkingia sp. YR214]